MFRRMLSTLAELHNSPVLQPGHQGFCPAALCARSVLDDFDDRARATGLSVGEPVTGAASEVLEKAQEGLCHSLVDARLFQLCCPALEACRQDFQVRESCCLMLQGCSIQCVLSKEVRCANAT